MVMPAHSLLRVAFAGLARLAAAAAHAAEIAYPTKPIRLLIPFPPGGSADPLGRALGVWFSDKFGVPVVADNRPGAGTAIAHTLGAKAVPDGYTLLLGASSGLTTNPALGNKLDYDPTKSYAPVGLAAYVPQLLVVHPSVAAKSFNELTELAKTQPGKINFASPGVGTVGHLSIELFNAATGARFVHVPYKGAGPAVIDLVGGRVHVFQGSVPGTYPQVSAGRIRALATGHRERLRAMPDLPTIAESLPGFTNDGWYGIVAPAGTPAPIVSKLNAELKRALANAEFSKSIDAIGMEPAKGGTPQELREWIASELARWTKVVRDAGIQAQAN
jgi:tripartite-type tricarboxylate transporter receptor subunit TctC